MLAFSARVQIQNGRWHHLEKFISLSLQYVDLQKPCVALDMGIIWSMATAEDRQTQDCTPDYVHKISSVILARHRDADRIICVNDAANSTKDDERDLRVHGKTHIPNSYIELTDLSPVPKRSKRCYVVSATKCGCKHLYAIIPARPSIEC